MLYKHIIKRLLDAILAFLGIILLSPFFIVVSVILMFANKGTPFFFQKRPGKNEKIFKIVKFKTMNDKKDLNGRLLEDEFRLTKTGSVLRKYSIDELPQLLNILIGNMSFVGPRPLLTKYLPFYTNIEKQRHLIRPGLTGLAQISGRNLLGWDNRLEKDVYYVNNLSFMLDLKIIVKTINKVIKSKDVIINPNSIFEDLDVFRSKN